MSNNNDFSRRNFLSASFATSITLLLADSALTQSKLPAREEFFYVGTYTSSSASEGVYFCSLDLETGNIALLSVTKNVPDPSFLAIDRGGKYLYAVNELLEFEGKPTGSVSSFAIDHRNGGLKFINKQSSGGGAPCHISISDDGKFILLANYLSGNVAVYPIGAGGSIGQLSDLVQHNGSGPNKERQMSAHAHSITFDRKGRFAVAADLGIDKVMIYKFDRSRGKLVPNKEQPYFQAKAGAGPRHFAFHRNGRLAFVINELDSSITSFSYNEGSGTLKQIDNVSTLPRGFIGTNTCADIHLSPDGKFLYGSNRGSDTIVVFKIDEDTGQLMYVENTPTGGKRPRNFVIDPTGRFLLAANQETGNVVVFRIEKDSGRLQKTNYSVKIPAPVCLKFLTGAN